MLESTSSLPDDELRKKHVDSGCRLHVSATKTRKIPCSFTSCTSKQESAFSIACPKCHDTFCLQHRHPSTHACRGLVEEAASIKAKSQTARDFVAAKIGTSLPTGSVTTNKPKTKYNPTIELMKMRMTSKGDEGLPVAARVYFRVTLPKECNLPQQAYFFDNTWTIGRLVDKLADMAKCKNVNNLMDQVPMHLHIYDQETGKMIENSTVLSKLTNGSRIVLERESSASEIIM
ncbi:hypothetical protein SmJEL517_g03617 [Synchytrium microbalum]|uniref:AN1-type domain-containing protein n=1 Tax=Synchytrium microbalum TaxID=1806994 RepID=A0A507BVQ8_9FUNG|nr:uncharacterized protein SmJEL517_g03617 [Synchytrium microbalum]TPX33470.1 hypothetical protein SmJEL517_g03617 [Synchytrium microbalum]